MRSSDARRTRPRALAPGAVAVALVAVLACVTAFLVTARLLEDDGPGDTAPGATTRADGRSPDAGARPPAPVRCWNGSTAARPAACSEPDASPAAFAWVFPDVDLSTCTTRVDTQRTITKCFLGQVEMNLSRWRTVEESLAYYAAEMGGPGTSVAGGRLVWTAPTVRFGVPQQKSAVAYAAAPVAVG